MNKLKYYSLNIALAFMAALILLFISATIFAYTNINDSNLNIFVFVSVIISVLVGAMLLTRKLKEKGLLYGAVFGIIYFLIIYICTALTYRGLFINNAVLMYLGISTASGAIGGIIGVNL
ncbi:hypothetical protein D3C73_1259030 [compost metagenome]